MKFLYTVIFALFLFNMGLVLAAGGEENVAAVVKTSELSRRFKKRYLEKDSVQKLEKRLQGTQRCPFFGCLNDDK